jgi:hypothetical protein
MYWIFEEFSGNSPKTGACRMSEEKRSIAVSIGGKSGSRPVGTRRIPQDCVN